MEMVFQPCMTEHHIPYSFPHYLLAKQSVDDRALNKDVLRALQASLPQRPIRIIEVGAGIGTMVKRLVNWNVIDQADYVLVDEMRENISYASEWLEIWARESCLNVERGAGNQLRIFDSTRDVHIHFECADIFDFIPKNERPADLLIAHAFLDLLPMPDSLHPLLTLTNSLAWLTLNFDGVTTLEPAVDVALDERIEALYHRTMDERPTGGESRSGRHLFEHLKHAGAAIVAAGSSDWVVFADKGSYPQDEAYFLHFILHFFEESLGRRAELNGDALNIWLKKRHSQIEHGELTYITHQIDFLIRK